RDLGADRTRLDAESALAASAVHHRGVTVDVERILAGEIGLESLERGRADGRTDADESLIRVHFENRAAAGASAAARANVVLVRSPVLLDAKTLQAKVGDPDAARTPLRLRQRGSRRQRGDRRRDRLKKAASVAAIPGRLVQQVADALDDWPRHGRQSTRCEPV